MNRPWQQQEAMIFCDALELADPALRRAFLDQACAGDSCMRARVEKLLANHPNTELFFAETERALTQIILNSEKMSG
jgi:hypothetical protein